MFGDDAASKWRGAWVDETAYKKSDIIEFDGSSYIAVSDHQADLLNILPGNGLWNVVAASGANGAAGDQGDAGADSTVAGPAGLGAVLFDSAPTSDDDMNTYTVGTVWIDTLGPTAYILVDNSTSAAVWTVLGGSGSTLYAIGDAGPAGGIVFHVTDGGLHGLEAAPVDQTSTQWNCDGTDVEGVENIGSVEAVDPNSGAVNTPLIAVACGGAAAVAAVYVWPNGQTAGFLSNKEELYLLYDQKVAGVLGGFASTNYWSSSEASANNAWIQFFDGGGQNDGLKTSSLGVRAVRAF
jgi:hypothetical protein